MRCAALIPVKPLGRALQRLSKILGADDRRDLQVAMLTDLLAACALVPGIERTLVVTSDPVATDLAHAHGAEVACDHVPPRGINAAVALGLGVLARPTLVLMADLAAARPADLEFVLANVLPGPSATLVPSRDGTGTNAMFLDPPGVLDPHLGPGSLRLHIEQAKRLQVPVRVLERPALALDVDTPEDLEVFWRSPLDGATRRVLARTRRPTGVSEPGA